MKSKRASLKDRLIFLFTGKIRNYALYANEDILRAHMKLITNKQSVYYEQRYKTLGKEKIITIMNFLATSKIKKGTREWKEFIEAFPEHRDSRRPNLL